MKTSFADKVRKIIKDCPGETIMISVMFIALGIKSKADKQSLYNTLIDLREAGEIIRIKPGEYKWANKPAKPQLREVMWRILRSRKKVSVEDLQELSGAKRTYIKEFLQALCRMGITKRSASGTYIMIKDPIKLPDDDKKADKLRKIRQQKKKDALAALDNAQIFLTKAIKKVEGMDD